MTAYNHAEFHLTGTRATIDDEERRLIDEALAEGKAQKIPTGKSAFAEEYVWRGSEDSYIGRLEPKNPLTRQEALARYKAQNGRPQKENPRITHRRAEVLRLTNEGYSAPEISQALGCSAAQVKKDRESLQSKGKLQKLSSGANGRTVTEIQDRRKAVLKLIKAGKTNRQVAEQLGETIGSVRSDRVELIKAGKLKSERAA